jgi:uncharacterized membrane protein YciS (DUF1049 family)
MSLNLILCDFQIQNASLHHTEGFILHYLECLLVYVAFGLFFLKVRVHNLSKYRQARKYNIKV